MKGTTRKVTSQVGGFLNFFRPLKTAALPLMKSLLTQLARNILIPLRLTAAASATAAAIEKKIYGSGKTALITSDRWIMISWQ